jgi:hypothetical protein
MHGMRGELMSMVVFLIKQKQIPILELEYPC